MNFTRRQFFQAAALAGLTRKSGVRLAGDFVHESHALGHRLRDRQLTSSQQQATHVPVVIIGGGIAGLSAAWRLTRRGFHDFVLLEMEPEAGGNSRSGSNQVSAYPWAAHYVPVPGNHAPLVRELFEELGVLKDGRWEERHLCHAPQERLFLHGRWQAGFEPQVGPTARDREQVARFEHRMAEFAATAAFRVPTGDQVVSTPLDAISMAQWLSQQGLDSPWLRWLVDYACRDDYGARAGDTSAWAGIHYFASRAPQEQGPLTWPEGNGWITKRLLAKVGDKVKTGQIVTRVARQGRRWSVATPEAQWIADAVIFAAPSFLASRVIENGPATPDFHYSPWLTANLTLDRWPSERGAPVAWDNVIVDSPSLGYVVATHQSLRMHVPRTVWTYYWALADGSPRANREWLLAQDWASLAKRILDDLSRAHPDIRDCVSRVDICRMGHAMIRPTPGFLSSSARRQLRVHDERLFFAHSDVSGLSLFEEAQYRGVTAADRALENLSRPAPVVRRQPVARSPSGTLRVPGGLMRRVFVTLGVLAVAFCHAPQLPAQTTSPSLMESSRQLLRDLVSINTAEPDGNTTAAASRVADFLKAAGFPAADVQVIGTDSRRGNLVARLRGRGTGKPVLFLAHLDVVPAMPGDWTTDPYTLVEKDGYYYGRGTTDDKQFCAIFAAVFAQLKREGFVPDRDLVLALTTGEESGANEAANGVMWLLKHHRPLVDAAYVVNGDAGGGAIAADGRYLGYGVQAGEKLYADFTLEATHEGGHSSRPVKGNPIYRLARALSRVETLALPLKVGPVTQPFLAFLATVESGRKADDLRAASATPPDASALARLADEDPSLNAQLRTTCVATQVTAGHAPNALPQRARANVNCRILPGETPAEIRAALVKAIDDPAVGVTQTAGLPNAPPVRLDPAVMALITRASGAIWPGVPVIPVLEVGGTDGFYFRELGVDVYGVNHFERDEDKRAHGKDERIGIKQFDEAAKFGYELAKIVGR